MQIPAGALIFIGDGRKALFLRNDGNNAHPSLRTERVFVDCNPPTHEQGTQRPGRSFARFGPRRSAVEQTDWHHIEQEHFVRKVCEALEKLVRENPATALIIAAPPHVLGELRRDLHDDVKACIIAEVGSDLTNQPLPEIAKLLAE